MDEIKLEQINELIDAAVKKAREEILEDVVVKDQGVATAYKNQIRELKASLEELRHANTNLEKQAKDTPDNKGSEDNKMSNSDDAGQRQERLTLKALQQQFEQEKEARKRLEEQIAQEKQQAFKSSRNSAISELVASSGVVNPSTLKKLFELNYADKMKAEAGTWFIEDDDNVRPLKDVFGDYLNSEEGELFQPPSNVQGSGAKGSSDVLPANQGKLSSSDDFLLQAFADL